MPTRSDVVAEELDELLDSLKRLWIALTADPKKQARKERAWSIVAGAFGAGATMAARRVLAKVWPVLTGEPPPPQRSAQAAASRPHEEVHDEAARETEVEAARR
jgi:hypothetical protein